MKYTYEEIEGFEHLKRSDGAIVPKDPANSDYQRYLRWLDGEDESAELP